MYRFYVSTAYEKAYSDSATLTVLSTHDHDPYDVVTFPSTCTDTGLKDIYCECGKLLESDVVIPALGHDWTLVYADNCGKVYKCERCEETYTINLDRVVASAVITDQNELVITIVERFADGTSATTSYSIMFDNNVAGTYKVGGYRVYVDAKDNDQIRACYILGG
jgi:hypothetical protein